MDISTTGNDNSTIVSLAPATRKFSVLDLNESWDHCKILQNAQMSSSSTNMGEAYFAEKIDAEMKTFPWHYPEQYILSDFIPSPCNFPV